MNYSARNLFKLLELKGYQTALSTNKALVKLFVL